MKLNKWGFGSVEFILILVIVGMIVGVALYVMQATKINNDTASTDTTVQVPPGPEEALVEWKDEPVGTRFESAKQAFSFIPPGGWELVIYEDQDAMSSGGSCIDNNCVGGFLDAPDKPIVTNHLKDRAIDFYSVRFAIFTEDSFVQKFTNEQAEKSDFGPVDGVMGTRYYQVMPKTVEYQKEKEGHTLYEYSFAKNEKFYHVYYDIYGDGEADKVQTVEGAIRTLKFEQ